MTDITPIAPPLHSLYLPDIFRGMSKKKPTVEELQRQLAMLKVSQRAQFWGPLLSTFLVCITIVGCFYFVSTMVVAMAGKTTTANIDFLALDRLFAWATTAIAGGGWYRERQLRARTTKHMAPRVAAAEKLLDPGRRSSRLQLDGTTNPEDKP